MVMRRLDQVLADVLTELGIVAGSAQAKDSAHPPRLAEEGKPAGWETDGEADGISAPSPADGKDRLPASNANRVSRAGLTRRASVHAISPASGQARKECRAGNWKSAGAEAPASLEGLEVNGFRQALAESNDNRAMLKGPAPCTVHRSRHTVAPNAR